MKRGLEDQSARRQRAPGSKRRLAVILCRASSRTAPPDEDNTEALGQLARVRAEIAQPKPKPHRIKAALASITQLSKGTKDAGNLLTRVTALSHTIADFYSS